jgi:hypothetical protein
MSGIPLSPLGVDPDAAFEAMTHDQIGGAYQVPAELVRLALAHGATRVEVRCRRGRLVIDAPGAKVPELTLGTLRQASNGKNAIERIRALGVLEDRDASALGWAWGLRPHYLMIQTSIGGRTTTISGRKGEISPPGRSAVVRDDRFFVEIVRPHMTFRRAVKWLEIACRFSPVPVVVNGRNMVRDLSSGCFRARITRPLPAVVALGVELDAPRLWLLRHGVVATRAAIPNRPPFEAAVEMEGIVGGGQASGADLRRAVAPYLGALISRTVELTLRIVPRLHEVDGDRCQRIVSFLLKAAEAGLEAQEIWKAALFEWVNGWDRRWLSLEELANWPGTLPGCVDCRRSPGDFDLPHLCIGSREREMVVRLIGRTVPSTSGRRRGLGERMGCFLRDATVFLRYAFGPRSLPNHSLTDGERTLVRVLEEALMVGGKPVKVSFRSGRGSPRRWGNRLVLARWHRETRAAIHAISLDSCWIYCVAVAMKAPEWTVAPEIRLACIEVDSRNLV